MADTNIPFNPAEQRANYYKTKDEESKLAVGSFAHQVFSGATFGLSSVAAAPFMSDETRSNLFQYQVDHPLSSAIAYGVGAIGGTLATLGLTTPARLAQFGGLGIEAAQVSKATRFYQLLQGVPQAATLSSAVKSGVIGGMVFGGAQLLNDASLDPAYVQANMGKYAEEMLISGGIGLVTNVGIHKIGQIWDKYRGGSKNIVGSGLEENSLGNANTTLGEHNDVNQLAIKNSLSRVQPFFEAIQKNQKPELNDLMEMTFYSDLKTNKRLEEAVASGDQNLPTLMQDWLTSFQTRKEMGTFGSATSKNDTITALNHRTQLAQVGADTDFIATLSKTEEALNAQAMAHFSEPANQEVMPLHLTKDLTQTGGRVDSIQQLINERTHPKASLSIQPGETSKEFAARLEIADLPNNKPRSETATALQTFFDRFKAQVTFPEKNLAQGAEEGAVEQLVSPKVLAQIADLEKNPGQKMSRDNLVDFFNTKFRPQEITEPAKNITQQVAYEAIKEFLKSSNNYFYGLRKTTNYVIDAQGDALFGAMKKEMFNILRDAQNFGEFGILAGQKTEYLSNVNTIIENMYRNLEVEKVLPKAPFVGESKPAYIEKINKRAGFIRDVFQKLQKVSVENADWRYTTQKVIGDLETTRNQLFNIQRDATGNLTSGYMQALHDLLPTPESQQAINSMKAALDETIATSRKISALNNENVNSIFGKSELFTKERKGVSGAVSIENRLIRAAHDFAGGLVVPQDVRFGELQLLRIGLEQFQKYGEPLYGGLLGLEERNQRNAKKILHGLLNDGEKLAKEVKTVGYRARQVAESFVKLGKPTARRIPQIVHNYSTQSNQAENIRDIKDRFDKIDKNLTRMQTEPSLYAERIHFALKGVRSLSPAIADEAQKNIYKQMGLVQQIFPRNPDDIIYKPQVPLSKQARFLDQVDAITNPNKILDMMRDGTVSSEQLGIFKSVHPELWNRTVNEVSKAIFYQNPTPEAKSRAYAMFGFQNMASQFEAERRAQAMLSAQAAAKKAPPKPKFPKANMKFMADPSSRQLTNPGVR